MRSVTSVRITDTTVRASSASRIGLRTPSRYRSGSQRWISPVTASPARARARYSTASGRPSRTSARSRPTVWSGVRSRKESPLPWARVIAPLVSAARRMTCALDTTASSRSRLSLRRSRIERSRMKHDQACFLRQVCDGDLDRKLRAVGAHARRLEELAGVFGAVGLAAGAGPALESLEMLGREQGHGRTADHVIVLALEGALRRRVEVHDVAVDVEDHDRVGRRFHHRARALLARLDAPGGACPFECSRGERRDHVERPRIRLVESLRPPGHQLHHTDHFAVVRERRRDRGPEPALARGLAMGSRIVLEVSRPLAAAAAKAGTRQALVNRHSEAHLEIDDAGDGAHHQLVTLAQQHGHAASAGEAPDPLRQRAEHALQVVLSRCDVALGLDDLAEPLLLRAEDRLGFALFGEIDDVREDVRRYAFFADQGRRDPSPDVVAVLVDGPKTCGYDS